MKNHFIVSICTGTHIFSTECRSISDAYYAAREASAETGTSINMDRVMRALVHMEEGRQKAYEEGRIVITAKGEEA